MIKSITMKDTIDCIVVGHIQANCWLYSLDEDSSEGQPCIVIDPGDDADRIILRLKELNWVPRYIFATHGHFDHVTALPELLEAFNKGVFGSTPKPKVGIHKGDIHHIKDVQVDIFFDEGDMHGPFKILHLPGHTQGCVAFHDVKMGVVFTGDTMFKGNRGRTDLPGGNEQQIYQSLERLLTFKEDTIILPGHGPATTINEEIYTWPDLAP